MTNSLTKIDDIILHNDAHNKPILVDVRFIPTSDKRPIIIFIHGFKGFKDWGHWNLIADQLANQGFCVIKLNLSHNGTTPEKPTDFADLEAFSENTYSIELDDMGVLIDYLYSSRCTIPNLSLEQLFLIGHSRGGGLALLKANEDKRVNGVITWASVSDYERRWPKEIMAKWKKEGVHYIHNGRTKQEMPMKYDIVKDFLANKSRLDIKSAIKNSQIPLLLIHGSEDPTVGVKEAIEMNEWGVNSELYIIEGANHVFDGRHPFDEKELPHNSQKLVDKTLSFLRQISGNL